MELSRRWIGFGAVTVVAMLAAFGTSRLVARILAVPDAPAAAEVGAGAEAVADASSPGVEEDALGGRRRKGPERPLTEEQYRQAILGRNIFDQSKIGLTGGGEAPDKDGVVESDLKVELKGTVVADPDRYSVAFLLKEGDPYAHAYGIGQQIMNATILAIEEKKVKISRNGTEEWLVVGGGKAKVETATAAAPTGEPSADGITQISETEFAIDKATVDANLNDLESLSKLGRALLHRGPDGEYDGYRLSAIRRGSVADKLGIRNGDIIHSVNGTPLSSVQGAMEAFQSLSGGTSPGAGFKFEVTRRGQPVTLSYSVR